MLITFIACHLEQEQAVQLATWIRDLGGVKKHDVLVCLTKSAVRLGLYKKLQPILAEAFNTCDLYEPYDEVEVPWKEVYQSAASPNHLFRRVAKIAIEEQRQRAFFWMEMDCVPLRHTWADELEAEYAATEQPFMGALVQAQQPRMSGIGIYPGNISSYSANLCNPGPSRDNPSWEVPFDVYGATDTLRSMCETKLIQHVFPHSAKNTSWLNENRPEIDSAAAVFHPCKDGSLIDFLRVTGVQGEPATAIGLAHETHTETTSLASLTDEELRAELERRAAKLAPAAVETDEKKRMMQARMAKARAARKKQ